MNPLPRRTAVLAVAVLLPLVAFAQSPAPERESYAIGYDLGRQTLIGLRADGLDVDVDALVRGFEEAMREQAGDLSDAQLEATLAALHDRVATRQAQERLESDPVFRAQAEQNHRLGREFRERFAQRENAERLGGGVLYIPLESGDGAKVGPEDTVTISFTGRFIDGTLFGEDAARTMRVDSTLAGGRTALVNMRAGDRWLVVLPPEQAFGLAGREPDVGPNETLIVDVEVLEIAK